MAGSRVGLVGRDGVLARLSAHLAGAAAGDCRFVLLCGEPGIGKSRLAAAVVETAERRGFSTMWGGCRETEGAPPFWPWTQVFRAALAGHADLDGAPAPLLNPQAGGETDRFRLFDAAVRTLADLARTNPVLYYSRGFPVRGRAVAQRDAWSPGCGDVALPSFVVGWLPGPGDGDEPGVVVVPAGSGLVASSA